MSLLSERIKRLQIRHKGPNQLAVIHGIDQVVKISAEADELMENMAAVLESASVGAVVIDSAKDVLDSYDDWKERNQ